MNGSHGTHGMRGILREEPSTRLRLALTLLALVVLAGTLAYRLVEGWPLMDAFYMTIITISTVGLEKVRELDLWGRIITMALIVGGIGTASYAVGCIVQVATQGEIQRLFGRRKLAKQINALETHFIVAGFGRMGRLICHELSRARVPFVVVEKSPERTQEAERGNFLYVLGDASDEEVLKSAGIEKAKGLVAVLNTDADNVFVTLTARQLNPNLLIISRAEDPTTEPKLKRAGANRVISPHAIGARRITEIITRPAMIDFIDVATQRGTSELEMDEIVLVEGSPIPGKTLEDSGLRQKSGVLVVAIKRSGGQTILNPGAEIVLEENDTLITIGPAGSAARLLQAEGL